MLIQGQSPAGTDPIFQRTVPVTDPEAKKILGARSYKGRYADLSPLFRQPSTTDSLISLGITLATSFIPAGLGALGIGSQTLSLSQAVTNFGMGALLVKLARQQCI